MVSTLSGCVNERRVARAQVWSKMMHSEASASQSTSRFNAIDRGNEAGGRYTSLGEQVQLPFIKALDRLPSGDYLYEHSQTSIVVSALDNTSGEEDTDSVVDAKELELFTGVFKHWDSWQARSSAPGATTQPSVSAEEGGEGRSVGDDVTNPEHGPGIDSAFTSGENVSGAPKVSEADLRGLPGTGPLQSVGGVKQEEATRGPEVTPLGKEKLAKRRLPRRDGF